MRLLQIMNRVPWPLKDGGSLGYYNYTKGYHDAGVEVTVCALNTHKHYLDPDQFPKEITGIAEWRTFPINTDVKPLPALLNLFSSKSYNIERFQSPGFEQVLIDTVSRQNFDVIVFESLFVAPYVEAIRKHTKALLVLRQHNVEHKVWETLAAGEANLLKRAYLALLARRMKKAETHWITRFQALTTVTQADAAVFKDMGCRSPIFVSPFGIDMSRLTINHDLLQSGTVFHLGSMEWLPNRQAMEWFLTEVWPRVTEKVSYAKFVLAGRGMPESFRKFASASVEIAGEVDDAIRFMQQHQIMIVPLFAGSGIRVKILEGMALGKAIVSTPLGAEGIAYANGKDLLVANDAEGFTRALINLISQPEQAAQLGANAASLAHEQYDNTKVIQRLLPFYQSQLTHS